MKKNIAILILRLMSLISMTFALVAMAMAQTVPDVKVGVYGQHIGGKLVYRYRAVNNSPHNIAAVRIGYDSKNDKDNNDDVWELIELPSEWDFYNGIPPASATSPQGWHVYVITLEESESLGIVWEAIDDNSPDLFAGQTLSGMSVVLDKADSNYLTGHAFISFANKPTYPNFLTVPLERLDTTPPTLTVTFTPATLWPPNNKLVPITATFTVSDDYDPAPEIKLESITASESLAVDDIQGAQFGSDDRQFSLAAKRAGTNPAGRIYTVTYSATDGSGNKATASASVTVPHDQGK